MDTARIAELLEPFFAEGSILSRPPRKGGIPSLKTQAPSGSGGHAGRSLSSHSERSGESTAPFPALSQVQLSQISTYIDLLLRWNARINLTAVRKPEHIVTRHFGESLFAARHLFPHAALNPGRIPVQTAAPGTVDLGRGAPRVQAEPSSHPPLVVDIGSGAGFPGLPIKIWAPDIHLTLIESNYKKATFLREVIRALTLTDVDVFVGRAEAYPPAPSSRPPGVQTSPANQSPATSGMAGPETAQKAQADVVTLRAIEHIDSVLPVAALLLRPGGQLALLLGASQVEQARTLLPMFRWEPLRILPQSAARVFLVGSSPLAH